MPHGLVRIAVCQIECHPALTIADLNYLREPRVPQDRAQSLGGLARHDLDLVTLQQKCEEMYLAWQEERLKSIFSFLGSRKPVPELIVFPETSIPLSLLHIAKEFAIEHDVTVFAGTHSYQCTRDSSDAYKALGIKPRVLKEWGEVPWGCTAVLPVFSGKSVHFHRKRVPSVFEITDVTPRERASYALAPLYLTIAGQRCRILPVVCAEALQRYTVGAAYDLAVVCAYNAGTEPYDPFIDHHVFNRIPVVLCNDGRYGGSDGIVCSIRCCSGFSHLGRGCRYRPSL